MTQQEHKLYTDKIADYVLGLLPDFEQHSVEQHVVGCADCRALVSAERQLLFSVKQSLSAAQIPSANRMAQLMPEPPAQARRQQMMRTWQRGFALAAVIVLLWMGNFGWGHYSGGIVEASPSPTLMVATATTPPTAIPTQLAQATALPATNPPQAKTIQLTPIPTVTRDQ